MRLSMKKAMERARVTSAAYNIPVTVWRLNATLYIQAGHQPTSPGNGAYVIYEYGFDNKDKA